jgi:ABC-type amino acid transport substrate-binding protein
VRFQKSPDAEARAGLVVDEQDSILEHGFTAYINGIVLVRIVCLWLFANTLQASAPMTYVYHPPESSLDVRYLYHWEILRTALEKTKAKWGPYRMVPSESMTERRQAFELKSASGKLTVMYLSTNPDFERNLIPIRIPVDRNLGGYCIFLIRDGEQARFNAVKSLDDLRKFSYGLGLGWIDVDILKANRFNVVTGSSYDGLFEMLANKRFDVFLRAAVEVLDEYEQRRNTLKDLRIEDSIVFYYPLPMYFWFSKNDEGRRLAARAEEGMRMMIADGTYDRIFDRYQRRKIERLRLKERRIFRIANPFVGPETPFADKRLWFYPKTYR